MRTRYLGLLLPLVLAACASTAGSPSPPAPSAAAPSPAPASPSPAASAAPSVAPSEAPASVDPGAAFRDETLQPVLDEITTSLTRWGEAATAAAAPDAPATARIALASAAFRVRTALASGSALLGQAEVPECATDVSTQATTFIEELSASSEDLLANDSASPDEVGGVIQQAADGTPGLIEALAEACAA